MSYLNKVQQAWFYKPRMITWKLYFGVNTRNYRRRAPIATGQYPVTLSYLDSQGDKWGETYIKAVGQHFDDYSNWNTRQFLYPLGSATSKVPTFVPLAYEGRFFKEAAPGVTGLIGEVIDTTFFQKILRLRPFDIAHLKSSNTFQAPDFCLNIQPNKIADLLPASGNSNLKSHLLSLHWTEPLPVESKGRKDLRRNHARDALSQLITYWRKVPEMAGYGLFTQVDLLPNTAINVHVLAPKATEILNVRNIVSGNITPALQNNPTLDEFKRIIGVRMFG